MQLFAVTLAKLHYLDYFLNFKKPEVALLASLRVAAFTFAQKVMTGPSVQICICFACDFAFLARPNYTADPLQRLRAWPVGTSGGFSLFVLQFEL